MSAGGSPVVVVGGSVASLVAADALAAAGRRVEMHLPESGVGGGFTPITVSGRCLELGARLIELSYDATPGESPPLSAYRPGPHGHRPYLARVDAFVRALAGDDLVELSAPQASVGRRRMTDYVLTGDLSGLGDAVDEDLRSTMAAEAKACVDALGPRGLYAPDREQERWALRYSDAGRAHTGATFHDLLIAPVADKILPGGAASVVAALHRKIWMPLFHPVTAWEACAGTLTYRPDRPLWSVQNGGMGEIVLRLLARVEAAPGIVIHRSGALTRISDGGGREVHLAFADGSTRTAERPVVGVGAGELFRAAGVDLPAERVPATMVWVDVPDDDVLDLPSVLCSAEPDIGLYRVTESLVDRRTGHRTLCCEVDHRRASAEEWLPLTVGALTDLGVTRPGAAVQQVAAASQPAFVAPSHENRAAFGAARAAYDALGLTASVVAGATSFGVDTFNEQVVQGLAAAETFSAPARRAGPRPRGPAVAG